jgi:hypothetical protein
MPPASEGKLAFVTRSGVYVRFLTGVHKSGDQDENGRIAE